MPSPRRQPRGPRSTGHRRGFSRDRFPIRPDERSSIRAGRVTVPPRGGGAGRSSTPRQRAARLRRSRDAAMPSLAAVRQPAGPLAPVAAASAVATDDGLHVHLSVRVASRVWRCARRRTRLERKPLGLSACRRREAAAVQVRSEPQADSPGRPGRHRLPGQGARHGRRCRGQRLDHRREQRHRDEDQSGGQASPDHRRAAGAGEIGTKPKGSGCCGSR